MAVKFCGVCGPILLSRSSLQWQSNFVEYVDQYYCHDPHSNGSQILWSMWDQYYCHDPHSNGSQILWSMWTNITVTILTPMAVKFCGVCGPILLSRSSLQWQSNFVEYVDQYYCHDPHSNGSKILWSMWTNITVTILTPMAVKFCGVCGTNITVTILTPMAVKFCGVCGPILLSRSSLQWQSNFVEYADQYYCHDPHSNGSQILWSSGTNITVTILTPMAVKFCGVCGPILLSRSSLQWQSNFVELVGPILLSRSSLQWQSNFVEYVDQYYCHDPHSNGSQILWSMWTNITVTILTPMAVKFCRVCGPILLSRSSLQWQSNFVEYVGPILLSRSSLQWQ